MKASIGLFFYKVTAHVRNSKSAEPCDSSELKLPLADFLKAFILGHADAKQDEELERSWYFEEKAPDSETSLRGYVHYGTYGFESRFKNAKTKTSTYDRKVDDVEEIPLFYEFWSPEFDNFTLASFQSFQGRSCVGLVRTEMKHEFELANPGFMLRFQKLVGVESPNAIFAKSPVKKLTLIQHKISSDKFKTYSDAGKPVGYDFEIAWKARRGGFLGDFKQVTQSLQKTANGLVLFDGEEFDEAIATVMVGKRQRPIGLVGPNSDTGAIDVSETIERAPNGHPTFDSIAEQSTDIAMDFHKRLTGR